MRTTCALLALACAACPPPERQHPPSARVRLAPGAPTPADDPPPPLAPIDAPTDVEVYELGLVAITDGVSPEVLIDVDDSVRSFTVLLSAQPELHVVVDRVESPDGTLVVDPAPPADASRQATLLSRGFVGPFLSQHRMVGKRGAGAFIVPATPDVVLGDGTWRVRVSQARVDVDSDGNLGQAPIDRPLFITVLVDTRAARARARLPVALHFTGARDLTAASAVGNALVDEVTTTLADAYGAVGIDVERAGSFDVDGGDELRTLELLPDLCEGGDLARLVGALAPTPGAVDVVFVERMQCLVRGATLVDGFAGLAAGIPGDVLSERGPHGGVAVALGVVGDDAALAAHTVAHELGHLLGLFHTMELVSGTDPPIYDIISDTPDDPGFTDNLMSAAPQPSTALTDGQAFVLMTNPWLEPSAE